MISFLRTLLTFLCVATLFAQGGTGDDRREAVRSFYATALAFQDSGIPSKADIRRLKPLVSRNLGALLEKARKAEILYARKTKGAVPPLVESRIFFSLFEGASRLQSVLQEGDGTCQAELAYDDGKHPLLWKDRVFLVRSGSRWVVDDIAFLGEWAFGDKGRLQENLRAVIQAADEAPQE